MKTANRAKLTRETIYVMNHRSHSHRVIVISYECHLYSSLHIEASHAIVDSNAQHAVEFII